MKHKGVATSLIALSVLLFIASGNIFGALVIDGNIMEQVSYNRGDYALIAESKVKADLFPRRVAKELNYTSNNAALALADSHGDYSQATGISWNGNIPSEDDLKENYYAAVYDRIVDQTDILGCEGPEVLRVSKPAGGSTTELEAPLSQNWIKCNSERSEVKISLSTDTVESDNVDNRYIDIASYTPILAAEAKDKAETASPINSTGTDNGNTCPEDSGDELEEAKSNARSNALSGYNSMGDDALEDTSDERHDWISAESSTNFDGSVSGSITDSRSCEYNCETDEEGNEICESGTVYDAEASYEANQVDFEYSLSDSQKEIINSEAEMEVIEFEFTYKHSLD